MQEANKTATNEDSIMQSFAEFLSDLWFEVEFRKHPEYLTEIFEYILETEIGNDLELRNKMMSCIKASKMLAKALEPFSDQEIEKACAVIRTV
ncbi:hypothetical protein GKZ90_0000920 [Flavobacterium sp. MC2016-06]|jgi:hypothetical protein|uniref:hypothetical protein n=1 Tax=Flavobacterium sp. MC2016-06 TaxID=2676308 RepID=UPI0012BAD803|nr:hypothetical protein [Flavobacterium sp. MC2016-06]MBU3859127.1 hypothetical protein [Flavobacterium sp. MC2016-06]